MKKHIKTLVVFATILFAASTTYLISSALSRKGLLANAPTQKEESISKSASSTDPACAISPKDYQSMMGVGMDVDFAKTGKGISAYDTKIIKDFKAFGISHIRIRIKDDATEELLTQIERVVNDALANNVIPVIAYQANDYKLNPNQSNLNKAVDWWRTVAKRFASHSYKLSFNTMIEPSDELNNNLAALNLYHEETTKAIRESNPLRIVFVAPGVRSSPENLQFLQIPSTHNDHVMVEWHFYAAGPSKTNANKLWTVGTESEKNLIRDKIAIAKNWGEANQVYTWVGAWMPGNYNDGDDYTIPEQIVFANFMTCELKKNNIPHAFNSDVHFYDRENLVWINEMLPVASEIVSPTCAP
jgi:hypothetical protein